jgi:FlaG/FlaF family flagellin (archaellin)
MNRQKAQKAMMRIFGVMALAIVCVLPAAAQTSVTSGDIQRLQDQIYEASTDISRVRGGSSDTAVRLQSELDDLRDEVVYLKVKMRKEGNVSRNDYSDVRDRLQDLRSRARGEVSAERPGNWRGGPAGGVAGGTSGGVAGGTSGGVRDDDRSRGGQPTRSGSSAIPVGQEIDVRLQSELSSDTAQVEQRFEATTAADLYRGNDVLIPAGSVLRGVVSSVNKATRTDRKGSLTVAFDQITISGRRLPMRGTVTQAIESEGIKGEAGKIGTGGAIGGIIGGILGGVKGALLGVLIGGGGTIAATEGKDVDLPAGTILRVRLDTPPAVK